MANFNYVNGMTEDNKKSGKGRMLQAFKQHNDQRRDNGKKIKVKLLRQIQRNILRQRTTDFFKNLSF